MNEQFLTISNILNEKALSKSQQRLFGMVRAAQQGKLKTGSRKIKSMARSIDPKDVSDFARTSTKNLPERKKKKRVKK